MRMSSSRQSCIRLVGMSLVALATLGVASCGGSSSNPFDNPAPVANEPGSSTGQKLSFAYFQKCINPILIAQLPVPNGSGTNTCAGSGCHDTTTGTGGALRIVPGAQPLDVADPTLTPDAIRASDMYKNFYSAQGEVVFGSTTLSRILAKPMLINVLHGGGLIFDSAQDPNAKVIQFWINNPAPSGTDEFSSATFTMFTPADPNTGTCRTQ